jgi:hypothetical protein
MSAKLRRLLLRFNAVFLLVAALGAWLTFDFPGSFAGSGPLGPLIAHEPSLGIGFVEAHGLALILAVLLWRAPAERSWHVTAAAIHLLLGVCNIVFWNMFVATNTLPMGWVTTVIHGVLVLLQAFAASSAARMLPSETHSRP